MHRLWEVHEMIARRAYELYRERDCEQGHADEDWLRAEKEILSLPHLFQVAYAFHNEHGGPWGVVARRAYIHYLRRGARDGHAQEDWAAALQDTGSGGWWYQRFLGLTNPGLARSNYPFEREEYPKERGGNEL